MEIKMPSDVERAIEYLKSKGYNAYAVGGCVRDSIEGRIPNDWDLCTSASPEEIKKVFQKFKSIDIGIKHGTVVVLMENEKIEITTYRIDGEYKNNRHPEKVEFTKSLREDLKRRDFTINAMAYNKEEGIIDYFQGKLDLKNKIIRCVGVPEKRFEEDALRIMRGIRFATELGFSLDKNTEVAMINAKKYLKNISYERIREELNKIILCDKPSCGIDILYNMNIIEEVLPKVERSKKVDYFRYIHRCKKLLTSVENNLNLRLFIFVEYFIFPLYNSKNEDDFVEITEYILHTLRYDKAAIKYVVNMAKLFQEEVILNKVHLKRLMNIYGIDCIKDFVSINENIEDNTKDALIIKDMIKEVELNDEPYKIKHLDINGEEITTMGVPKGKVIGTILERLLEVVIENPKLNVKEKLKIRAVQIFNEMEH